VRELSRVPRLDAWVGRDKGKHLPVPSWLSLWAQREFTYRKKKGKKADTEHAEGFSKKGEKKKSGEKFLLWPASRIKNR